MKGSKGELQAKSLINNELAVENKLYKINQRKSWRENCRNAHQEQEKLEMIRAIYLC